MSRVKKTTRTRGGIVTVSLTQSYIQATLLMHFGSYWKPLFGIWSKNIQSSHLPNMERYEFAYERALKQQEEGLVM